MDKYDVKLEARLLCVLKKQQVALTRPTALARKQQQPYLALDGLKTLIKVILFAFSSLLLSWFFSHSPNHPIFSSIASIALKRQHLQHTEFYCLLDINTLEGRTTVIHIHWT